MIRFSTEPCQAAVGLQDCKYFHVVCGWAPNGLPYFGGREGFHRTLSLFPPPRLAVTKTKFHVLLRRGSSCIPPAR